ncbi:MAG: amidohydrolase family protein [Chitinophagaceae bacterium]
MIRLLLFVCLFTCSFAVLSQSTQKSYRIKTGSLFDSETATFKKGLSILVKGNMIEAVKTDSELTDAEKNEYTFIDLSAYTILPGLIDAHTHLLSESKLYPGSTDPALSYLRDVNLRTDALRALYGAARAKTALEGGITAVQDLGNSGLFADVALREAINIGYVPGPRMRCSGPGLSTEGGQFPGLIYEQQHIASKEYRIVKSVDDAIQAVRENLTQKADVIKIYSDNAPNPTMLSVEEMKAIVNEAHRYGIRVTAHAVTNTSVYNAVMAGVDGIEHGYQVHDTTLQLMARKGVVWIPTFSDSVVFEKAMTIMNPTNPNIKRNISARIKSITELLQKAVKAGVTIVAGADDYTVLGFPYGEMFKRTLFMYHTAGIGIPQVLQSATIHAAKHLRWENRIGSIKKGFWADIIAVDPAIEKDINVLLNVKFVMKGGAIVKQ